MSQNLWSSFEDLGSGIFVYHDLLSKDLDIIDRLENALSETEIYNWSPAYVGYKNLIPEYRDCQDFKFKKSDIAHDRSPTSLKLQKLWQDIYDKKSTAINHYSEHHGISKLRYWEAFNFVKYEPGHHFMEHCDHGFSYNCTVSVVGYINDNYEGGELYFRLQGLNIKPKAGDVFVFPSNYMYPHQAKPVISGTKYSIVTMLDYSDKYHKPEFYQETGT